MVKLIALDLDGTLLNSQKEISSANVAAIKAARQAGVYVVLCTGRPILRIAKYLQELDLISDQDYAITFNGALVQITGSQKVVASHTHSKADALDLYEHLYEVGLPVNVIDLEKVYEPAYPAGNPSLYAQEASDLAFETIDFKDFQEDQGFSKAICCCPADKLDQGFAQLGEDFKNRYTMFKSMPTLMEIMPKGVDKAAGIASLCQLLDIKPEEVMAMGDAANDLSMLHFAGYSVAMANGTDEVKAVAKYQTDTNDHDGVAKAIQKYVFKKVN